MDSRQDRKEVADSPVREAAGDELAAQIAAWATATASVVARFGAPGDEHLPD